MTSFRLVIACLGTMAAFAASAAETGKMDAELRQQLLPAFLEARQSARVLSDIAPASDDSRFPFSLVVKGGVSLGVYEAGMNWAILRILKDLSDDTFQPDMLAAAGASAGAINGFATGLFWCNQDSPDAANIDNINDNILRDTWRDIDLTALMDHDMPQTGEAYDPSEDYGLFSRKIIREIQSVVERSMDARRFRPGCEAGFGFSLTRSDPVRRTYAGVETAQQRLVVPLRITADGNGDISIRNQPMPIPDFSNTNRTDVADRAFLSSVIYLDERGSSANTEAEIRANRHTLSLQQVFNGIKGSASFPVAFSPIKLSYCSYRYAQTDIDPRCPRGYARTTSRFLDGGVFDNDPLELVRMLTAQQRRSRGSGGDVSFIKISPDSRRYANGQFVFDKPAYAEPGDSIEIGVWTRDRDSASLELMLQQCRGNQTVGAPVTLSVASSGDGASYYVTSLHLPPAPRSVFGDNQLLPGDHLLLYHDSESQKPVCNPAQPVSVADRVDRRLIEKTRRRSLRIVNEEPLGLSTQLGFIGGSISAARTYRLHDELLSNPWRDGTRAETGTGDVILHPTRLTPVVGDFLFAFASFLDVRFRDFDYYAGVYDAVYSMTGFVCRDSADTDCESKTSQRLYSHLCSTAGSCRADTREANTVLLQLATLEQCGVEAAVDMTTAPWETGSCVLDQWTWLRDFVPASPDDWTPEMRELLLIGAALQEAQSEVQYSGQDPFVRFVRILASDARAGGALSESDSRFLRRMMARVERPVNTWFYPVVEEAVPTLLALEDRDKRTREQFAIDKTDLGGVTRPLLAFAGLTSETMMKEPLGWQWQNSSVPDYAGGWWNWAPAEFAIDTRNGGGAFYWKPTWHFSETWRLELRTAPYLRQRFENRTIEFSEISGLFTYRWPSALLTSVGIGPSYSYTWSNADFARDENFGAAASAGFLGDKVKLTYGLRSLSGDDFAGDDIYWHLSVNDIPGLAYWAAQGF